MSFFKDKVVLVTGAGGSIGSVLCQKLVEERGIGKVIMFDSSELALYNISRQVKGTGIVPVLGDVSVLSDVQRVFHGREIDIVFHAAAYKHVTICEQNKGAAYRVNVTGTRLVVQHAAAEDVPRLVLISTDKAVSPSCVMGLTKQRAEEIVKQYNYTTIRLGNVWGSSGSVAQLWKQQIADGEPVTITHPNATRYFISPGDAGRAILSAAENATGGEVFVPEMGPRINIVTAARMLLGATEFRYIGLQPGEKLNEQLFNGGRACTNVRGLWKDEPGQQFAQAAAA